MCCFYFFQWDRNYPKSISEKWYKCPPSNLIQGSSNATHLLEGDDLQDREISDFDMDEMDMLPNDVEEWELYHMADQDDPILVKGNGAGVVQHTGILMTLYLALMCFYKL